MLCTPSTQLNSITTDAKLRGPELGKAAEILDDRPSSGRCGDRQPGERVTQSYNSYPSAQASSTSTRVDAKQDSRQEPH